VSVVIAPAAANLSVRLPAGYPVSGTVGTAYTAPAPTVAGGTPPYTYIFAQNAPPGLTMAPTTGIVTGTPTKVGTFNPAIKVTDSATPPNAAFTNYVFVVSASGGQTLAIGPTTLGTLTNGTAVTPITLTSTPATTEPYTWSVTSGALPAGLVLNNGTTTNTSNITSSTNSINITGTPTTTGPYSFTLSVTDSAASVGNGSQAFSGSVSASTPTTACAATPALRGNEAALTTPFAFLLEGFDGTGAPLAWAGSFTPDGTGKVTNADLDFVGTTAGAQSIQVNTSSSSYSYGADGRGCLYLTFTGQTPGVRPEEKLRPAALVNGGAVVLSFAVSLGYETGRMQQFDYVTSTVVATGEMHEQTASDFAVSEIASNFAFGYDGWVAVPAGLAKVAIAGSFENSSGTLSLGAADENIAGTASGLLTGGSGSLDATVSATTGRGTGSYTAPTTEGTLTFTFAYYIVNGSDLFIISTNDPTTQGSYLLSGRALKSLPTSVALDGYYIPALMGIDLSATPLTTSTTVGTLNVTTGGAFTTHIYNNTAGTYTSTGPSGTSTFTTATGRVTFPGWTNGPVGYVTATADEDGIAAFLVGTDTDTSSGFLALQGTTAPNFTASNISGTYAYSSGGLPGSASGAYAFVSAPPTFNATTDVVTVGETASKPDQASNGPFVVNPDGTGTVNGNTVFTTNGALIIGFDTTSTQPQLSIWVSETLVP
jgi:hypothetical protein